MKKIVLVVAVVLVFALGAIYLLTKNDPKPTASKKSTATTVVSACKLFTLSDAKKVLGDKAVAGTPTPEVDSDAVKVSSCTYSNDADDPANIQTASILVRSPKNKVGITSNKTAFNNQPAGSQAVSGYGQQAYWSPIYGQLNVLKNNTWTILSVGPVTPSSHTLTQTETLANIIVPKL